MNHQVLFQPQNCRQQLIFDEFSLDSVSQVSNIVSVFYIMLTLKQKPYK